VRRHSSYCRCDFAVAGECSHGAQGVGQLVPDTLHFGARSSTTSTATRPNRTMLVYFAGELRGVSGEAISGRVPAARVSAAPSARGFTLGHIKPSMDSLVGERCGARDDHRDGRTDATCSTGSFYTNSASTGNWGRLHCEGARRVRRREVPNHRSGRRAGVLAVTRWVATATFTVGNASRRRRVRGAPISLSGLLHAASASRLVRRQMWAQLATMPSLARRSPNCRSFPKSLVGADRGVQPESRGAATLRLVFRSCSMTARSSSSTSVLQ